MTQDALFLTPIKSTLVALGLSCAFTQSAHAQSADWTEVVWREPQVRYLLADMSLGGNVQLYRNYAVKERDPDSREAIRLWDAGSRVVNTNDFKRRWLTNKFGKDGRVMRVVLRGTTRTITGNEALLSSDGRISEAPVQLALAELTLGRPASTLQGAAANPEVAEALRRWAGGCRVVNTNLFEARGTGAARRVYFRHSDRPADPAWIRLNSDLPYPETNVRYFMADIALGGSIEFYRAAAERDHEMGCLEAVRRTEEGYRITNLDQFERKEVEARRSSPARVPTSVSAETK